MSSGMNSLNLNETVFVSQGSMVVWRSNDGAVLVYKTYPTLPDLIWRNDSLSPMTVNSTLARVLVMATGFIFLNTQLFGITSYFPVPGNYMITELVKVRNSTYLNQCSIIVTDGNLIKRLINSKFISKR